MKYTCISADCHLDLGWLPPTLFTENASASVQEFMPYVTDSPDGPTWVNKRGAKFGLACGVSSAGRKYVPGLSTRVDRMAAKGIYTEASRASRRLADPHQRIKDQDIDGVQAEVLYGILGAVNSVGDPAAGAEVTRIYNDWLADFCKPYPNRLIGLGLIPGNNVKTSIAEAKRLIAKGTRGLEMSMLENPIRLLERQWDPLWAILSEARVPVHFHLTTPVRGPQPTHWNAMEAHAADAVRGCRAPLSAADYLMEIMFGGALERFPNLKVVFGEAGLGWIPYILERIDEQWEVQYRDLELKMKPSEYWKRQCKSTFQFDNVGLRLLDQFGEDTIMWGSDFPHRDGVWPDSQDYIQRQFSGLPDRIRQKVICDTAVELYQIS